ncbi:nucleotide exchange factor GrpE [Parasphingopyxis sp. CP4]|uniref:nucleotide exchange factor GrpE n=1 Tax=Parasphingopyxis sp. CP4 TaxID=2724527 RepID=UPI0015A3A641|nr:nucleotide exchange factor GrpE [Parasphingopyxis sp. CP4]QLC21115.1 nucleotide exchange factor GrpE [Parasphingopyxis sp. CP4]
MNGEKTDDMDKESLSEAAEAELAGVPEDMLDDGAEDDETVSDADRVVELEEELAEAKQAVLYAKAEEQNTRRRLEQEKQNASSYAATGFARDILSVADNLERALDAIPDELREDEKFKGLVAGLEATGREIVTIFAKHGIEPVEAIGEELDPNRHQAMVEIPTDDAEPGTIVQQMQRGYVIKDRLLRPALVGVAKKAD